MTAIEIPTPDPRTLDDVAQPFARALAGQFAIRGLIGSGGMGIVYLARDKRIDRLVAIKTLPPKLAADPTVRARFLRETRTAGAMSHPNIVPIHGADEIDGHVFFVMSYIDGESLATRIRTQGALPPREVALLLRDVAAALVHAHDRGIIHRDIKAENILIDRATGRALVTDFGIAHLAEAVPLTATGQLLGTVYYVSPEQVSGAPVDARSDLYSLGVLGFLALTERFPFDAGLASAVLVAHVTQAAPPIATVAAGVPRALAAVIDRCLAKNPARRYANASEVVEALESAIADIGRGQAIVRPAPALISSTEAHAVWGRAAELQASTGIRPRPEAVPRPRDEQRDQTRTSGFALQAVQEAASEAGIGRSYVEHALVEHGLRPPAAAPVSMSSPPRRRSLWAGAQLDIVEELEVEGELLPRDFDRIINSLRDGTARLGTITARSREVGWSCTSLGFRLDVSVVPDHGRTRIRLTQSVRRMAANTILGGLALGAAAGELGGLGLDILLNIPARPGFPALPRDVIDAIAIGSGVLVALAAIPAGRATVRWLRKKNAARLQALAKAVAVKVRECVGP